MQDLGGKVAVITGGGSGIGRGIARALAREGARVVVADIDAASAETVTGELGSLGAEAIAVETDVREQKSVDELLARTKDAFGGVDLVFNNAGVYLGGPMPDATFDDWRFVLDVNLDGVFRVGQTFARELVARGRGGHLIHTASVGGFIAHGGGLAYGVSKFGVVAYSEAQRAELEPHGIGVSTLCPGPIDTNLPASDRLRARAEESGGVSEALAPFIRGGMSPEDVGPIVLSGIRRNLAYIFTDDGMRDLFAQRFDAILAGFDEIEGGGAAR